MEVILMDGKCKECGTRLTQFEIEEKQGYCVDCFKERENEVEKYVN